MRRKTDVSSPLVPIMTAAGTGATLLTMAALGPICWPLILLSPFLFHKLAKQGLAEDLDRAASQSADDIADEWERTREAGERELEVKATLYSEGALFNLPITRTYRYSANDEDDGA